MLAHRLIANRLKDCAYGEPPGAVWQNIVYDEYSRQMRLASSHGPPEQWKTTIPTVGSLSLDYISATPIPDDAVPLVDNSLIELLRTNARSCLCV